jgi:D-alanyl-D-alanine carboxypeptidase (penicillin-binding protein 5/6)|tara:strand:+ start:321 stop:1532 length:1212 start_codon:yes stop_codon:yes gene_type:complete
VKLSPLALKKALSHPPEKGNTETMPRLSLFAGLFIVLLSIQALATNQAAALETSAREALLLDLESGRVLMEKNADQPMPPASMSKVMTVYLVFRDLKEGRLKLSDTLPVSEKAWRKGGSKMFVEVGKRVTVEDLIQGVIVQSGNDASIVLAEGLGGTEEAFAKQMTQTALELGMTGSNFVNATGWPDEGQLMTARDLSILAKRIIEDFPEYYGYFAEREFTYAGIKQSNRNPLLFKDIGADGLKTGHTQEAGFGLTSSAKRDDRRLILVLNGLESERARSEESERLLEWGFREFRSYDLAKADQSLEEVPVWLGDKTTVPVAVDSDLKATLSRSERNGMKVKVVYDSPVPAPIAAGQEIARLVVSAPEMEDISVPLRAMASVEKLGPVGRITAAAKFLIFGQP